MLLARFRNFIGCAGRNRQTPITQTLVCYQRGGITFVTEIHGGPGGSLILSDEECNEILKEIDMEMYIGERIGDLSESQLVNSIAFQQVLLDRHLTVTTLTPSFS